MALWNKKQSEIPQNNTRFTLFYICMKWKRPHCFAHPASRLHNYVCLTDSSTRHRLMLQHNLTDGMLTPPQQPTKVWNTERHLPWRRSLVANKTLSECKTITNTYTVLVWASWYMVMWQETSHRHDSSKDRWDKELASCPNYCSLACVVVPQSSLASYLRHWWVAAICPLSPQNTM